MTRGRPGRFGVFVLGMHRSGTSVAARLVNLMGFSLGPDEDLLPPAPDNPVGYWENAPLVSINDRILQALDGDWARPPRLDDGWTARSEFDVLRPAAAALAESVLGAERWAWKDPRNCLTLPFWRRIVDSEAAIVLVYRNPLEVAISLRSRDDFALPVGLALWERYTRSALAAAQGLPVCVTSHEQLMTDPKAWCERIGGFLRGLDVETETVEPEEIASFVRPELRHSTASDASLADDLVVLSAQREIHSVLEKSLGTYDSFTAPELPPETPWVEALLDERWRNLRHRREAERAEAAQRDAEEQLALIESSRSYRLLGPLRALSRTLDGHRRRSRTPPDQTVASRTRRFDGWAD